MSRGFTVVELLITLVIMTILLTLGVVSVRSTLINARDSERKEDISVLARGLELYYDKGLNGSIPGTYPGYNDLWYGAIYGTNLKPITTYAPGSSLANWKTPNDGGTEMICIFRSPSGLWPTAPGCESPGNQTTAQNQISPDKYGYESLRRDGAFCYVPNPASPNSMCTSFNLYWIDEASGQLKVYKSKHR